MTSSSPSHECGSSAAASASDNSARWSKFHAVEVVVDLDLVGVVRVEVDRFARVGALAALLVPALLVHECHVGTLPPVRTSLR